MCSGERSPLSVAALLMVAAGVHGLGPVRVRAQVLLELAAVQIVQHVQLDLFQVEVQRGAGLTQQTPIKPGLRLIRWWSCGVGETVLRVVLMTPGKRLGGVRGCWTRVGVHLGMVLERFRRCCVRKHVHVWVAATRGGKVRRGVGVGGRAGVGRLLVLKQLGEVVGHQEARGAERGQSGGGIGTLGLGVLLQLLPPAGPVLVVGIIDGVLDPQTLGLLHVRPLLSQRHGLPGSSYRKRGKSVILMLE